MANLGSPKGWTTDNLIMAENFSQNKSEIQMKINITIFTEGRD
jgi:hypothetical protein